MIFGGSAIIFVITLIIVLVLDFQVLNFPLWVVVALPLSLGLASFGIFYFFVERFINDRLKLLYRSIRKGKITKDNMNSFKMTDEVFAEAEKATNIWAEERHVEISKLQEQEEYRREFLGNLAHELKTPVFSIQGYILTLLDGGGLEDPTVNRMFLERASLSVDRMVNLLEDLDEITKMEAIRFKLDLQNFNIRDLVKEVIESLELKANEKNISLTFPKDTNFVVYADRAKISQVLVNLINNSINYGNEGGVTNVRFYEMNDLILIEISDNGLGIDEYHLPRLFERFYRVEKSRTRNEGGSGLGLAIVKYIVESHKQNITVRSTVGLGSTFAFSLDTAKNSKEQLVTSRGVKIR